MGEQQERIVAFNAVPSDNTKSVMKLWRLHMKLVQKMMKPFIKWRTILTSITQIMIKIVQAFQNLIDIL